MPRGSGQMPRVRSLTTSVPTDSREASYGEAEAPRRLKSALQVDDLAHGVAGGQPIEAFVDLVESEALA